VDLHLDKQVVFVAGSSRGIGRSIAEVLLAEGACVVVTGRDEASLKVTQSELEKPANRGRILAIAGDFSNTDVIGPALSRVVQHFGRIDHMVANLGTGRGSIGWDQAETEWQRLFEHNFFASVRLAQTVLPHLLANPSGGSILFIASIAGLEATAAPLPYSAAKAALVSYSKNLARQLASQSVRVNTIAPGNVWFEGGSWQRRAERQGDAVKAMLNAEVPQNRFGTPAEIASMAAYLCSSQAGFCTGGCYVVDGGQTRSV
jgi:3-oxoacyl-[acyl-carrier protein] reductase